MQRIYPLLFFIITTLCSYGQDSLQFTRNHYNVGALDTTTNHSFGVVDTIYTFGQHPIYGPITFIAKINGVIADNTHFNTPTPVNLGDSLSPGTLRRVNFSITNDTAPPFVAGANLIIIWPVYYVNGSPGYVGVNDSIRITAEYYPLAIAETPLAKIFLFQTQGLLNVRLGDAENIVKQVRIYNILGQNMYSGAPEQSQQIPTSSWVSGIYLLEVTTYNGEKKTIKFRLH